MSEENIKNVELGETKQIELPQLDVKKYVGTKSKIAAVTEHEGEFGYFIRVESEELDKIKNKEGQEVPLKATRIFGLQTDADGQIGWGEKTKLGVYLKKMGVNHYRDLVGKEIIIQTRTNKDGVDFLDFN